MNGMNTEALWGRDLNCNAMNRKFFSTCWDLGNSSPSWFARRGTQARLLRETQARIVAAFRETQARLVNSVVLTVVGNDLCGLFNICAHAS
jgi:hypothetical protein